MWKYEVKKDGDCKVYLYPAISDLKIGGYGYNDVVVYKGAPVSFKALERALAEIVDAHIVLEDDKLVLILKAECEKLVERAVEKISKVLIRAERDLTELEKVIDESVKSYMEKRS